MKYDGSNVATLGAWQELPFRYLRHQDRSGVVLYQLVEHWPIYDDYDCILGIVAKPTPMAYRSREYALKLASYLESAYLGEVRYSVRIWGDAAYRVFPGKPAICEIIEFPKRHRCGAPREEDQNRPRW